MQLSLGVPCDSRDLRCRARPTGYVIGVYPIQCMIVTEPLSDLSPTSNGFAERDYCVGDFLGTGGNSGATVAASVRVIHFAGRAIA